MVPIKTVRAVQPNSRYEVLTDQGWQNVMATHPAMAVERLRERGFVVVMEL